MDLETTRSTVTQLKKDVVDKTNKSVALVMLCVCQVAMLQCNCHVSPVVMLQCTCHVSSGHVAV